MGGIVDICNRALSKLGQNRITSIDDANEAARACNHAFEFVRDAVLRDHPWNCTVSRVTLAPLSTTPAYGHDYEYQMPSDCLKVLEVDTTYDWAVEGRKILTDEGPSLNVRYQIREEDPNQYDAVLFEVMAARLSYELCEELTQSNTKKQLLFEDYRQIFLRGKMQDAQEGSATDFAEDEWVNVRY